MENKKVVVIALVAVAALQMRDSLGFMVKVNAGNAGSIMIEKQPQDTVAMLKNDIQQQRGIAVANQIIKIDGQEAPDTYTFDHAKINNNALDVSLDIKAEQPVGAQAVPTQAATQATQSPQTPPMVQAPQSPQTPPMVQTTQSPQPETVQSQTQTMQTQTPQPQSSQAVTAQPQMQSQAVQAQTPQPQTMQTPQPQSSQAVTAQPQMQTQTMQAQMPQTQKTPEAPAAMKAVNDAKSFENKKVIVMAKINEIKQVKGVDFYVVRFEYNKIYLMVTLQELIKSVSSDVVEHGKINMQKLKNNEIPFRGMAVPNDIINGHGLVEVLLEGTGLVLDVPMQDVQLAPEHKTAQPAHKNTQSNKNKEQITQK